ncbi:MAG: UDP-N-acetylmuramate dehydrogenase [Patescibacteria group bacterium]
MDIRQNIQLAPYTTFKIGGLAKFFCVVKDQFDALNAYEFAGENHQNVFILGGGSNVLISDEGFDGLVARVENKGIEILDESESSVTLKIASGEIWDEVVKFAAKNNWWGIENLSHIPGSAGAIAIQNVGAYGQEASRIIKSVTVFNRVTRQILELDNIQCGFSYRKSIFNSLEKGRYIIFYISLILSKIPNPILSYRDLSERFSPNQSTINEVREAVIEIRNKKYPFPTEARLGNAGSFFKNPIIDETGLGKLKARIAEIFGISMASELETRLFRTLREIKVPAAYLMDICGLKDVQVGGAKINHNQPLVIINETGTATAQDVLSLARNVIESVYQKTGIKLQIEPELIGFSEIELTML